LAGLLFKIYGELDEYLLMGHKCVGLNADPGNQDNMLTRKNSSYFTSQEFLMT
jgi:hypothetical protein